MLKHSQPWSFDCHKWPLSNWPMLLEDQAVILPYRFISRGVSEFRVWCDWINRKSQIHRWQASEESEQQWSTSYMWHQGLNPGWWGLGILGWWWWEAHHVAVMMACCAIGVELFQIRWGCSGPREIAGKHPSFEAIKTDVTTLPGNTVTFLRLRRNLRKWLRFVEVFFFPAKMLWHQNRQSICEHEG